MAKSPRSKSVSVSSQQRQPVMVGSVTSTLMAELGMLTGELTARRSFAEDLAAWFKLRPDASEAFGEFQEQLAVQRSAAAAAPKNAL